MDKESFHIKPIGIIIVFFIIVFIILLVISIKDLFHTNSYGKETKIDNLSDVVKGLSQDKIDHINYALYGKITESLDENTEIPTNGAHIREDTLDYKYNNTKNMYYGNFIVDIPSVRRSYRITFEYSPDKNNQWKSGYPTVITCLTDPAEIIYPEFTCTDSFTRTDEEKLYDNLPYSGETPSGKFFKIIYRHYSNGNPYLEVGINSCGEQSILDEALSAAKNWIKSLDIDPEILPYELPRHYCENGAS